jgi:hypothetical protein
LGGMALFFTPERMAVVGNGNFDVGNETPTRRPDQSAENPARRSGSSELRIDPSNSLKKERPKICGAMAQQCGDNGRGTESTPQKLVQLVGYRDPKAQQKPWVRPGPLQMKQ